MILSFSKNSVVRASFALALAAAFAAEAAAQAVMLKIRPRVGDTLVMRLDQLVELERDDTADTTSTMSTAMMVVTRAVVEKVNATATTLSCVTDSVTLKENGRSSSARSEKMRAALQGRRVTMSVAPDGGAKVVDGADANEELKALFSQMPGTLPRYAVSVGDKWSRSMAIPVGPNKKQTNSTVRAVFRLDSLADDGGLAYISMQGTLSHDVKSGGSAPKGTTHDMSGTIVGTVLLDRRRGWITDSRTEMTVRSLVSPTMGSISRPMPVRMKVTQRLRTLR
jgi:hypothetical protein